MQSVVCAGRTLVVSPHLDDAVLSCGNFLASNLDSTVLTVFAGMPAADQPLTEYDRQCGFSSSLLAMRARWREDQQALSMLGAGLQHLNFLDSQYSPLPDVTDLASHLQAVLGDPQWDTVVVPMGLFHCDHERVSDACMRVLEDALPVTGAQWVVYEDVPYRRRLGVMQRRLTVLTAGGWVLAPMAMEFARHALVGQAPYVAKRTAMACYASQLHALGLSHGGDQDAPERFWSITRDDQALN